MYVTILIEYFLRSRSCFCYKKSSVTTNPATGLVVTLLGVGCHNMQTTLLLRYFEMFHFPIRYAVQAVQRNVGEIFFITFTNRNIKATRLLNLTLFHYVAEGNFYWFELKVLHYLKKWFPITINFEHYTLHVGLYLPVKKWMLNS